MRFGRAALMVTLVLLSMPLAASAQPGARVPRIGILSPAPAAAASPGGTPVFDAFREALRELGYVEGRNITLEFRLTAGNYERLRELAADLVRLPVDVIVVDGGDRVARMALDATKTIPIVMATVNDPVMNGLVASLARPGGNITGFTNAYIELAAKRLQVLKEMIPGVTRVRRPLGSGPRTIPTAHRGGGSGALARRAARVPAGAGSRGHRRRVRGRPPPACRRAATVGLADAVR
jgi:putative ABC transport system substrate-binding protein